VKDSCPFLDNSQLSWIEAEREGHSTKPEVVRDLIMKVSPPPYLELFGRRTVPNWCVWGDAIEHTEFE
jgi:N6-adenosine-specific RNA methylase IME4